MPHPGAIKGILAGIFGLWSLFWSGVVALVVGTLMALPFILLPRGRRERFSIYASVVYAHLTIRAVIFHRPRVTRDGQRYRGGALVICNHRSWLDALYMVAYAHAAGLSKKIILYVPFIGVYAWLGGAVFFSRSSSEERKKARDDVLGLVKSGARVFVFPEGTRTRTGELREKTYLTLPKDCFDEGVPVIPCAVWGTEKAIPAHYIGVVPFQTSLVHIGGPLHPTDFADADEFANAAWSKVVGYVSTLRKEAGCPERESNPHS